MDIYKVEQFKQALKFGITGSKAEKTKLDNCINRNVANDDIAIKAKAKLCNIHFDDSVVKAIDLVQFLEIDNSFYEYADQMIRGISFDYPHNIVDYLHFLKKYLKDLLHAHYDPNSIKNKVYLQKLQQISFKENVIFNMWAILQNSGDSVKCIIDMYFTYKRYN